MKLITRLAAACFAPGGFAFALRLRSAFQMRRSTLWSALGLWLGVFLLAGCTAPIGADRVTTRQVYAQVEANALRTGKPSADTVAILHRYGLDRLAAQQPDEAVRQLHAKALATGERDLLFALSEISYAAAKHIQRSVKPWDPRDARDYYLGSAVYAWLFLFGESKDPSPSAFDRRFRGACDLYNYSLGLALVESRNTNGIVRLQDSRRSLPVGKIQVQLSPVAYAAQLEEIEQIFLADHYRVRGLSVRNREPGVGTPLICVRRINPEFQIHPTTPATVLLRGPASLGQLSDGNHVCALELYHPVLDRTFVTIGGAQVPLEIDLTAFRAYALTQSRIWSFSKLGFLAPAERFSSQLLLAPPYDPNRIPVVYVHGTFSSPVTWAEMVNSLTADPELRKHYQVWSFVYGSGNPVGQSLADLREALTAKVAQLDPEQTNSALRQMVIIGHSQGGLLAKGTAINAGDCFWNIFSTNRFENIRVPEAERARLQRYLFLEPLPFVKRVVFIATPHRGSYAAGGFARSLASKLVSLPREIVHRSKDVMNYGSGPEYRKFFHGRIPTSLDGMSPKNPALLAMAEIPVVPEIKAHSIIAVEGDGDYRKGKDGLVAYQSAHVDYVESEFIVRSFHSCLDQPATIEEIRRILHLHLQQLK